MTAFKTEATAAQRVSPARQSTLPHAVHTDEFATRAILRSLLVNHDLSIIVDRSQSMMINDCPDYPNYISRWDWCLKKSADLAQIAGGAASSVTLVFFDNTFSVSRSRRRSITKCSEI